MIVYFFSYSSVNTWIFVHVSLLPYSVTYATHHHTLIGYSTIAVTVLFIDIKQLLFKIGFGEVKLNQGVRQENVFLKALKQKVN